MSFIHRASAGHLCSPDAHSSMSESTKWNKCDKEVKRHAMLISYITFLFLAFWFHWRMLKGCLCLFLTVGWFISCQNFCHFTHGDCIALTWVEDPNSKDTHVIWIETNYNFKLINSNQWRQKGASGICTFPFLSAFVTITTGTGTGSRFSWHHVQILILVTQPLNEANEIRTQSVFEIKVGQGHESAKRGLWYDFT